MRILRGNISHGAATVLLSLAIALPFAPAAAHAQEPRFTIGVDGGVQFPVTLYHEQITATAGSFTLATVWVEEMHATPLVGVTLRLNPRSGFSFFVAGRAGSAGSTARYTGGLEGAETIERSIAMQALEAGMTMRLGQFGRGGVFVYGIAATAMRFELDLSNGHRDAFARITGSLDTTFAWTERNWLSYGLSLSAGAAYPLTDRLTLNGIAGMNVVGIDRTSLEQQEAEDVTRATNRPAPQFSFPRFTSEHFSLRFGLEYTIVRRPPPYTGPLAALPDLPPPGRGADAAVSIVEDDTASAVAELRARLQADPEDPAATRSLALVFASRAVGRPQERAEAISLLHRALPLFPADEALLEAYGRLHSISEVALATPPPLHVSEVSAVADPGGAVNLAWAIGGVGSDSAEAYRLEVAITDRAGRIVPLIGGDAAAGAEVLSSLHELEGDPADVRLRLRLGRVTPGAHSVRVIVTHLATGRRGEAVGGFVVGS